MPSTQQQLPELHSFPDVDYPAPEVFGVNLAHPDIREVVLHHTPETADGARLYAHLLGIREKTRFELSDGVLHEAMLETEDAPDRATIMVDGIDADTRHRYFGNPQVVSFADHNYVPSSNDHASHDLQTVGATLATLERVGNLPNERVIDQLIRERSDKIKQLIGSQIGYADLRKIAQSPAIEEVRIHALGPQGTNIQQVADEYVALHGLAGKANIILHDSTEPFEYARQAAREKAKGVLPLHIRCAVFYGERELYNQRRDELVMADHHYMQLDEMQVAARTPTVSVNGNPLALASHPSPIGLVRPWTKRGVAKYQKATSNGAAAIAVRDGDADVCITTESARQLHGLEQLHSSGSPMMMFTLGTPYNQDELAQYLPE